MSALLSAPRHLKIPNLRALFGSEGSSYQSQNVPPILVGESFTFQALHQNVEGCTTAVPLFSLQRGVLRVGII